MQYAGKHSGDGFLTRNHRVVTINPSGWKDRCYKPLPKEVRRIRLDQRHAKIVDKKTNAKLKVTFFWPFSGDYWILDLGPNYEYAVVGDPSRRYLWILSRTPAIDETLYQQSLAKMAARVFQTELMIRTLQVSE